MSISTLSAKSKLVLLIFLSGLIYSIFLNPMSTEHVEFGQTLAGMVPFDKLNGFYRDRQLDVSLQVTLPAILLRAGVPVKALSIFFSALTQMVPFFALGLLVFFLTENWVISYFSIAVLLGKVSPLNHFYPLSFPADFFAFGNLATWFAVLCIALLLNGYEKVAAIFTGIMISIHIPWSLPPILYLMYVLRKQRSEGKSKRNLVLLFLAGALISAASFLPYQYLKENFFDKSTYTVVDLTPALRTDLKNAPVSVAQIPSTKEEEKAKRNVWRGHNPELFLGSWGADILQFGRLMQFSVLSFLLGIYLIKSKLLSKEKVGLLLTPYVGIFFVVLPGLAFIEICGYYDILAYCQKLALRAIPNRFLNLSYIFYYSLIIAGLTTIFLRSHSRVFKIAVLVVAYAFTRAPYDLGNYLVLFVLASKYFEYFLEKWNNKFTKIMARWT